jgi:hypothetical protein
MGGFREADAGILSGKKEKESTPNPPKGILSEQKTSLCFVGAFMPGGQIAFLLLPSLFLLSHSANPIKRPTTVLKVRRWQLYAFKIVPLFGCREDVVG